MDSNESEGKTVAEAVENALRKLGLRRDQVEVQIIQEASSGFLGMGAKPARVKLTEKIWGEPSAAGGAAPAAPTRKPIGGTRPAPENPAEMRQEARPQGRPAPRQEPKPETRQEPRREQPRHEPRREPRHEPRRESPRPSAIVDSTPVDTAKACAEAETVLKDLLALMQFAPENLKVSWDGVQERVRVGLDGADAEKLAAGDGRTLESLQFLLTLIVSRKVGGSVAVQVDAMGYWDRREKDILSHAEKGIEQVRATGKPVRLPPMDAPMRRLIHRNLANHPDVETASEGEGSWRKIVIRPRKR